MRVMGVWQTQTGVSLSKFSRYLCRLAVSRFPSEKEAPLLCSRATLMREWCFHWTWVSSLCSCLWFCMMFSTQQPGNQRLALMCSAEHFSSCACDWSATLTALQGWELCLTFRVEKKSTNQSGLLLKKSKISFLNELISK